ncbi:hypothetical protein RCO28_00925 [Streptomyces sp. LHD-70]|uniref:hypothetical protein n=1 Tax=Streptomyces sp. LHD-70 TaxID=3072140 RepID=UPI00280E21D3|nr:hypothetical protein [Streptomyces sp. LHD-70]MDQ8701053.1 hypothetical protein [Streptomyces sp. LHD-70]
MDMRGQGQSERDELRNAFARQGQTGVSRDRSRNARTTRQVSMFVAAVLGLMCAGLLVMRLAQGTPAGLWTAFYALGALLSVPAWTLAKLGRTRWAFLTFAIGYALAAFGDTPGLTS